MGLKSTLVLSAFTSVGLISSACAECNVGADSRRSYSQEEGVLCSFGESPSAPQPAYSDEAYQEYDRLISPQEEYQILRRLQQQHDKSPSLGYLNQAVKGGSEANTRSRNVTIQIRQGH